MKEDSWLQFKEYQDEDGRWCYELRVSQDHETELDKWLKENAESPNTEGTLQ